MIPMTTRNYYQVLEVDREASPEVIRKAYHTLAQRYHPDRYHLSDKSLVEEKMKALNEAYQVLSDPARRQAYDARGERGVSSPLPPAADKKARLQRLMLWFLITVGALLVLRLGVGLLALPLLRLLPVLLLGYLAYRLVRRVR
jgi:hypothetical protein